MEWSTGQTQALAGVDNWWHKSSEQVHRVFGYAGTGKTTLAKCFADQVGGRTQYAAFSGKAAVVMRKAGCRGASTIHSLIYDAVEDPLTGKVEYGLNSNSKLMEKANLIIIDECSMVDQEIGQDLLSFGKPILVLGDPAQLPPIKGTGYFTDCEPNHLLTEIHRQAEGNPIIHLATQVRNGEKLVAGDFGSSRVCGKKDIKSNTWDDFDQLLVGRHVTRNAKNSSIRAFRGAENKLPVVGDKVICRRNNKKEGLFNGGMFEIKMLRQEMDGSLDKVFKLRLDSLDFEGFTVDVYVRNELFTLGREKAAQEIHWRDFKKHELFEYGYALTVHSSQGSQWENVCVFDESGCFDESERWLYTAITRASETVVVGL